MLFFVTWAVMVSGLLSSDFDRGTVLHAARLLQLKHQKQQTLDALQIEADRLRSMEQELATRSEAQVEAIRSVLGYVSKNEIIFDFGQP